MSKEQGTHSGGSLAPAVMVYTSAEAFSDFERALSSLDLRVSRAQDVNLTALESAAVELIIIDGEHSSEGPARLIERIRVLDPTLPILQLRSNDPSSPPHPPDDDAASLTLQRPADLQDLTPFLRFLRSATNRRRATNLHQLRARAEDIAHHDLAQEAADEVRRLFNELSVHQVELEMQNQLLLESRDRLESSETSFRRLFHTVPVPVMLVDPDGMLVDCNAAARGFNSGTHLSQWAHSQEQRASLLRALASARRGGKELHTNHQLHVADGELRELRFSWNSFRHPEHPHRLMVTVLDVTAERTEARAFRAKAEVATHANDAKTSFLANMSHELRTPLTAVSGYLALASQATSIDEVTPNLRAMRSATSHLQDMVEDLLDISRIELGEFELKSTGVNLNALVTEVSELMQPVASAQRVSLRCTCDIPPPHWVDIDGARLRQILVNLISNAIRFSPPGETVHVEAAYRHRHFIVTVKDQGPGIPKKYHQSIFEPFTQVDESNTRVHGGAGLGLAICKRIVAAMKGRLFVESTVGQGSLFTLQLPITTRHEQPHSPDVATGAIPEGAWLDALIVEDDPILQTLLSHLLKNAGWTVRITGNGEEALTHLRHHDPPDVVLMDMQMPVLDGFDTVRQLRKTPAIADLCVIGVTARVLAPERQEVLDSGCNAVITKPFDPLTFVHTVWQVVQRENDGSSEAKP